MKNWKHLTLDQRKVIANGISHNYKLKEIAETLGFDPTSISKEVKRNRELKGKGNVRSEYMDLDLIISEAKQKLNEIKNYDRRLK